MKGPRLSTASHSMAEPSEDELLEAEGDDLTSDGGITGATSACSELAEDNVELLT